jgi:hypothetical protein
MADFRIDVGFFTHAKTKRLRRACGLEAIYALLQLWAYATQNEHGAEKVYSADDIELAVDWSGEPGSLVSVLESVGFLDAVTGGYSIHEWEVHNGYAANAAKRSEAGRNAAKARWQKRLKCGNDANALPEQCGTDAAALPNAYESNAPFPIPIPTPNPKKEENTHVVSQVPKKKKSGTKTRHEYTPEYEAFFASYPARNGQKNGKHAGQKAFDKATSKEGVTPEFLVERIKALSLQYGEYPPDIATWLNNRRWEDPVANTGNEIDLSAVEAAVERRRKNNDPSRIH